MPLDHIVGEASHALESPRAAKYWNVPTLTWLAATRVKIAPGNSRFADNGLARRRPPPTPASSAIPSACMASLTKYSRSTGPSAARPSPLREYGVRPEPFSWMSRRAPKRSMHLAEKNGAPVAELRHELAELMAGIGHGDRVGTARHQSCRKKSPPDLAPAATPASSPSSDASPSLNLISRGMRRPDAGRSRAKNRVGQRGVAIVERRAPAAAPAATSDGFLAEVRLQHAPC